MSKKLGIILMFVGAYATLIGGLTWVMHFDPKEIGTTFQPYDWVWGLIVAVIMVIGAVLALKGYILGLIGMGINAIGLGGGIWLLVFGITKQSYLSPLVLAGVILTAAGLVIALIFHIVRMISISKHGNTLLN